MVVRKHVITLDQITSITVEATSYCNLHCPQCARFDQEGYLNKNLTLGHLNFDAFKKHIQLDRLTNLEKFRFEGGHGDILMHPKAQDFIELVQHTPEVLVITNGGLRSPAWWKNLASIKNLIVMFSIDGLEDTNHLYRINSDFNKTIANARAFIDAGGHAIWKFVVFQHNEHQIEQAREMSQKLGFRSFQFEHSGRSWWQGETWAVKIDGEFKHNIYPSNGVTVLRQMPYKTAIEKMRAKDYTNPESRCWATNGRIYINYLGHVLPCCMVSAKTWQNDIESKMWLKLVGDTATIDINQVSLETVLDSTFYTRSLKESFAGTPYVHPTCVANCG